MTVNTIKLRAQANKVELHKVPAWLKRLLGIRKYQSFDAQKTALKSLFDGIGIDHWGTTTFHQVKECFVTEPYANITDETLQKLKEKGRHLNFAVVREDLSFHNPGQCERILIFPFDLLPIGTYDKKVLKALEEAGCEIKNGNPKMPNMTVLEENPKHRQVFLEYIESLRIGKRQLPDGVIVEQAGNGFVFHCLKRATSELKNLILKIPHVSHPTHPKVEIKPIGEYELIKTREFCYESSSDCYVSAFMQKYVISHNCDMVKKTMREVLGDQVVKISYSDLNVHKEKTITVELAEPMRSKEAKFFKKEIEKALAWCNDKGDTILPGISQ